MMKNLVFCAILFGRVCLPGLSCAAQDAGPKPTPDVLIFTNGDELKGTLVRGVDQNVVFKSDMVGEITVPIEKIRELRAGGSFAVLRKSIPVTKQAVQPGQVRIEDGSVTVTSAADSGVQVPVSDIGLVIDQATYDRDLRRKPALWQGWNGSASAGATIVRSSQNSSSYTSSIALVRSLPLVSYLPRRRRTTLDFTNSYGRLTQPATPATNTPFSEVKTSIFHADAEQDEYLSPKFFALVETAFDHNFAQGLDLQQVYGSGFGWTAIQQPLQQLDVKADVHYEKQHFDQRLSSTRDQNLIGSTFSEIYRRNLPGKLVLTESGSILPAWNNLDAYSANGSVTLALPVYHRLSVALTTIDNFINNPASGFKKNSFQFITGISYTLR